VSVAIAWVANNDLHRDGSAIKGRIRGIKMKNLIAAMLLLVCGAAQAAPATDLECVNCVQTKEIEAGAITSGRLKKSAVTTGKIRSRAVTTGKIADGAVTVEKVAPELSNAIGTYCPPEQYIIGIDTTGNLVCESLGAWRPFDFPIGAIDELTDCAGGDKYVQKSVFNPSLWVGAQLCSNSRYKLYLAASSAGPYWEIGDGGGNGEDHCELIGAEFDGITSYTGSYQTPPGPFSFARTASGLPFVFGSTAELDELFSAYRTPYYECGISIPSGDIIPF
jgi:hypothetical protein